MLFFLKKVPVVVLFLLFTPQVFAEGLSTLSAVGKTQQEMQKAVNKETKSFRSVKKALETGDLKKGEDQKEIHRLYGDPVITLPHDKGMEKWVYKPGNASFFNGTKIYLFFDKDKKLAGIKMLNSGNH